jgi:hypothetical protein
VWVAGGYAYTFPDSFCERFDCSGAEMLFLIDEFRFSVPPLKFTAFPGTYICDRDHLCEEIWIFVKIHISSPISTRAPSPYRSGLISSGGEEPGRYS